MYEVEVKVRAAHDAVERALADAGAEERDAVEQADTYYDAPHRDFAETDEALRVRRETRVREPSNGGGGRRGTRDGETTARLTYKGPKVDAASKTRREIETGVADGDDAAAILEALGFEPAVTVRKHRRRFALDGFAVTLDRVEGLGEFVEVETAVETDAGTEFEDVEAAREGAFDVLRRLGLDPDDQIRSSYLELLLA